MNEETLAVVTLRNIEAGEELCISYFDEQEPYGGRQQSLYEHYLFECECPKCFSEALKPGQKTEDVAARSNVTDAGPSEVIDFS